MKHILDIDIETYSSVDLIKYGVYAYAASPDFEILMASFSFDDGEVVRIEGHQEIVDALHTTLRDPTIEKWAHYCQFERICFSAALGLPVGEYLDPEQWHDTAVLAAEHGYPRSLGELAKALGGEQKDEAGTALINLFCKPCRPTKKNGMRTRNLPEHFPEKWEEFGAYCDQDVVTLQDIRHRLPVIPAFERTLFVVDQKINDRGIRIDVEMANAAVATDTDNRSVASKELCALLGIQNANSRVQLISGFRGIGIKTENMQAETIEKLLEKPVMTIEQRRALELRQELALVASQKYGTALGSLSGDDRLRGMLKFHGAHTGRWSSKGVQIQNLARIQFTKTNSKGKKVWDGAAELDAILDLCLNHEADPVTLKKLIRAMFIGPFGVADYSAIEARVLAWVSGEAWVLQAFREKKDLYVETAERMSTPGNELTRAQGKVAVLALGYQGGINSLRNMGAEGTDEELQYLVQQWRKANTRSVKLWYRMQEAFEFGGTAGRIKIKKVGNDRHVVLPSGRVLKYYDVKRESFIKHGRPTEALTFKDYGNGGRGKMKGGRADTYGGRLTENVVQAISRDLLAHALIGLDKAGLRTVAHIHDEAIVEIDRPDQLAQIEKIMCALPSWAQGFPLDAEGYITERYRKD